jgi:adenylate cyclase
MVALRAEQIGTHRSVPATILAIRDWIVGPGLATGTLEDLVDGAALHIRAAGVPLDRMMLSVRMLSAITIGRGYRWWHGAPMELSTYDWDERDSGLYERSPLRVAYETGEWVELWLDNTPDDRFGIVPDLKAEGIKHYICGPMPFTDGTRNAVTFASTEAGGFDARAQQILRGVLPSFALACELRALRLIMPELLGTYVGTEPASRILAGKVHRGDVTRIKSAIMFVDMRDFTKRTNALGAEGAAELLNEYYDCVIPAVGRHGGTVLKLMGDGVLAIFPDDRKDRNNPCGASACRAALAAAHDVLTATQSQITRSGTLIDAGIALHYGEAAYGNVGSGERLDFTVVGSDVNLAHRIGQLNSDLAKPLLMSRAFAMTIAESLKRVGAFPVRGFVDAVEVFELVSRHSDSVE